MNFLHNFIPNPVLVQIGPITVHWYGLIIAAALISGVFVAANLAKQKNKILDDVFDLALWLAIAGIIGARLYDVLVVDWGYFSRHFIEIFFIWQGGLAIHGAIIGGLIALIIWSRKRKQEIWIWLDIVSVVLPLSQAIGRWGNYFNQELFGRPTDWPWGIPIAENLRPAIYQSYQYFHPAFLYESILNFVLFLILMIAYQKQRLQSGQLSGLYLIGYGIIRFIMEFIRIDPTGMLFGIRIPQLVSIAAIIIGLTILIIRPKFNK